MRAMTRPVLVIPVLAISVLATQPALAQSHSSTHRVVSHARPAAAAAPRSIGKFEDWQSAIVDQGGQTACYAFTRAAGSTPAVPGRGDVVLTVTQRPTMRDAVAISAGFTYPANAKVTVQVGQPSLDFYTAQRSAFAREGHAAVAAFQRGDRAVAKSPGPHDTTVTDTFSLRGFSAAYAAIDKACPAK
jgi:Invasion associated locus B (IalB) protein